VAAAGAALYALIASMGPRLCGRGDPTWLSATTAATGLQWGRAFVGAEMNSGLVISLSRTKLQWGRAFVGAEIESLHDRIQ